MRYISPTAVRRITLFTFALLSFAVETEPVLQRTDDDAAVKVTLERHWTPLRILAEGRVSSGATSGAPTGEAQSLALDPAPPLADAFGYEYEVTTVEPLTGRERSKVYGINNLGQLVGRFHNYDPLEDKDVDKQAILWDPVYGATILPSLAGQSSAWGINDNGQVSGYSDNADGFRRAVLWDSMDDPVSILDIGTLTNTTTGVSGDSSDGYDLNNLGQVTGLADIPNDAGDFTPFHAFLYEEVVGILDLGTFDTQWPYYQYGYSISYDVNSGEVVVGIAHNSSWEFRPFYYDAAGGLQELARDILYGANEWYAVAINDSGLVGGHVIADVDQSLPYYWESISGDPTPITMPAAYPYGEIYGMNESGQMVGIMWNAIGEERAFIFDVDSGVRDLNDLIDPAAGYVLHFARDINDAGQIAVSGEAGGVPRGFLLTPAVLVMGRVSGEVTDVETGAPIEGVTVRIIDSAGSWVTDASTDALGSYSTDLLSPGSYFAATSNGLGYMDEAYDDIPCTGCDPATGDVILVTEGSTTTGIDFALGHLERPGVTLYEDGTDGATTGWSIYDNDPPGATVLNVYDDARGSQVIELSGSGTANGYRLRTEDGGYWHNTSQFIIEWSMAFSENFTIYVDVETSAGQRFLYYTPVDYDRLGADRYVHHGVGSVATDGLWRTFIRDLQADLDEAQPGAAVLEVNGFLVRGTGRVDDIRLWSDWPVAVYEDGQDGTTNRWVVYDNDPPGAAVFNVYDDVRGSQVIELAGAGTANGYRLRNEDGSTWHNTSQFIIEWDMAFAGDFTVYVDVETSAGQRFLYYTPVDYDRLGGDRYVHHGVGSFTTDGLWRTFFRDLQADLEEAQAGATILEVNGFLIRGSGRVDDVTLRRTVPYVVYENGEDGTTDGWIVYDNDPPGAVILNVYDAARGSQVIELVGAGTANGYRLRRDDGSYWQNASQFVIEWNMAFAENFTVYIDIETTAGQRFLYYTPVDYDSLGAARYVHHGVGSQATDGLWRTFVRDLQVDLEEAQPGTTILEVNGFLIRGSGRVDDIRLRLH